MHENIDIDPFDIRILAQLQEDASLSNQEIAERVHLSASQISRRRQRLEKAGIIRRYRADLSAEHLGIDVTAFVGVTLSRHNRENARLFLRLVAAMQVVQEAYAMTGDMDYMLKVRVRDLRALNRVINDDLLPHEAVQNVRSSIALEILKSDNHLPLDQRA